MTAHTILLKGCDRHDERKAHAALKPGHLLELVSTGKVKKHSTAGGKAPRWFAKEDALQGKTTLDAYAADDVVSYVMALPGDEVLARLAAAAAAVVVGDLLVSAGDGTLKKPASLGVLYAAVAPSTAISNTVSTEQDFDLTYSLPANTLQAGDILTVKGHAVVSAQASTDTLTVKVYIGSTLLVTTAAVDSAAGDVVEFELNILCRTAGASGTFVMFGMNVNGVPATATMKPCFLASTAIDTTTAKTIKASATWSATNATNTVALQSLVVSLAHTSTRELLAVALEAVDNSAGSDEAFVPVSVL